MGKVPSLVKLLKEPVATITSLPKDESALPE
jgi:hypothetical protein